MLLEFGLIEKQKTIRIAHYLQYYHRINNYIQRNVKSANRLIK